MSDKKDKKISKTISKRLKELRKEKGYYQYEVAESCDLSTSTIGYIERLQKMPSSVNLRKLAEFFDVSCDYLCGRSDERKTYNDLLEDINLNDEEFKLFKKIIKNKKKKEILKILVKIEDKNLEQLVDISKILTKI